MSKPAQLKDIEQLYTGNLKEHGTQSKAVGWNTEDCQQLRFEKLCSLLDRPSKPVKILDYGCGFGSMLQYIEQHYPGSVAEYQGYDISEDMIAEVGKQLSASKTKISLFNKPEISTSADFGFVSGTFNVRFDADDATWEAFIKSVLDALNNHCSEGFAFNLLSTYVDWQEPHLYYGDPCYWFDFCKRNFSRKVTLVHDYPLWEWTIVVRK